MSHLTTHVDSIVASLSGGLKKEWEAENPFTYDEDSDVWLDVNGDECDALDSDGEPMPERGWAQYWLEGSLDVEYTVGREGDYLGARVLVTFGGPNVWVDFRHNRVEGHWGGQEYVQPFLDVFDIGDELEDYYSM